MKNVNMRIKPFSLWLSYNMLNENVIQDMLPPGMKVAKINILEDDIEPKSRLLFNCYNIDSFWMRGSRLEIMTIAKCEDNFHFVILDCITNTLQWDPINGIRGPNGNFKFNFLQDKLNYNVVSKLKERLDFSGKSLNLINMTKDFAVKSNYNCYYKNSVIPINLKFNEEEIMTPVRKLKHVKINNDLWSSFRDEYPTHAFMHEHTMNFKTKIQF